MMKNNAVICDNEQRRFAVRQQAATWNGLDYLEVYAEDPTTLIVYFINKAPADIRAENIIVVGGRRIDDIQVVDIDVCRRVEADRDDCVVVHLDKFGDHSTYTLRLIAIDDATHRPLFDDNGRGERDYRTMPGIDPRYDRLAFTFQAGCPTDLDCLETGPFCPPMLPPEPEIDYLAKDYASFRRLILDRLALIMPEWQEQHVPDIGITLVELLAFVGDYLSQYQDAVATEAYLQTARERISVRRHARLVDYRLHEGCNARAWLHLHTDMDLSLDPQQVAFITTLPDEPVILTSDDLRDVPATRYEWFEPLLEMDPYFTPRDLKEPDPKTRRTHTLEPLLQAVGPYVSEESAYRRIGPPAQRKAVSDALNQALRRRRLYDEEPFRQAAILANVRRPVPEDKRVYYNRRVLEMAFPQSLARHEWIHLYAAHNKIHIYTWADRECCLPRGATSATLQDTWIYLPEEPAVTDKPQQTAVQEQQSGKNNAGQAVALERRRKLKLQPGDFLLFEEILGPKTGNSADRDPVKRHVVRLTHVEPIVDELCGQPLLAVEWDVEDALPFALCITAVPENPPCELREISVARGNILLVDHGRTHAEFEDLGTVPTIEIGPFCAGENQPTDTQFVAGRYRPVLDEPRLTFRQPLPSRPPIHDEHDSKRTPATRLLRQDPRRALPKVDLYGIPPIRATDGLRPLFEIAALNAEWARKSLLDALQKIAHDKEPRLVTFLRQLPRELLDLNTWRELSAWLDENKGKGQLPDDLKNRIEQELNRDQPKDFQVRLRSALGDYVRLELNGIQIRLVDARSETYLQDENRRYAYLAQLLAAQGCEITDTSNLLAGLDKLLEIWLIQFDLLSSKAADRHFVVEIDNRRRAHLRFGDGELGLPPPAGANFVARYRIGNGLAGNVGAETITHILFKNQKLSGVKLEPRNPLPALGGTEPETLEAAKRVAPYVFKTRLERAITPADYVALVMRAFNWETAVKQNLLVELRSDSVQRAAATLRWNGSWYEAHVAVDPKDTLKAGDTLLQQIAAYLRDYKRMGHDLRVVAARYVPLDVTLKVCLRPHYLQAHVKAALLNRFSNRRLPDGSLGFFHPDQLSFGQSIRLSHLIAAAQVVPGVENVTVVKLQRHGEAAQNEIEAGILPIGPLEIARLDNDPDFPENGVFALEMEGGR